MSRRRYLPIFLFNILMLASSFSWPVTFVLPMHGDLVGKVQYARSEVGETLSDVGIRYDMGYLEMVRANPKVDPNRLLAPETRLIIPSQFILPPGLREGLVINLAEYRLYYYPPQDNVVITMPVGIGRKGWTTPSGLTKVILKERDPIWQPTAKLRAEAAKQGIAIPNFFPAGKANPLGRHVLRLGWPTYLIHGTNHRDGVGLRVSAGCIRMLPEDIEYLFDLVKVNTSVRVINEPLKFTRYQGSIYMQVHPPLSEQNHNDLSQLIQEKLKEMGVIRINSKIVQEEAKYPTGLPVKISSSLHSLRKTGVWH